MKTTGEDSVYPCIDKDKYHTGLTKREAFAMAAMQGLCAGSSNHFQPEHFAEFSIKYADALIAELNKTGK